MAHDDTQDPERPEHAQSAYEGRPTPRAPAHDPDAPTFSGSPTGGAAVSPAGGSTSAADRGREERELEGGGAPSERD